MGYVLMYILVGAIVSGIAMAIIQKQSDLDSADKEIFSTFSLLLIAIWPVTLLALPILITYKLTSKILDKLTKEKK